MRGCNAFSFPSDDSISSISVTHPWSYHNLEYIRKVIEFRCIVFKSPRNFLPCSHAQL